MCGEAESRADWFWLAWQFLHSFENISPFHSNEPPLWSIQTRLEEEPGYENELHTGPIVFFASTSTSKSQILTRDHTARRRGRRNRHCGEHKLVCGDNSKSLPTAGRPAPWPLASTPAERPAGRRCNNAKCQVCLYSECGQRSRGKESPAKKIRPTPASTRWLASNTFLILPPMRCFNPDDS